MSTEAAVGKPSVHKVPWSERLNNYICPMLLGGVLCFTIVYALYRPMAAMYTALFLVFELGAFVLFDKIKKKPLFGALIYIAMMIGALFGALYMMFSGAMNFGWMSPMSWFYGEEGSFSYRPEFLNAVFLGGGFFLISILYYFTQIRYRSLGVMLCILFPFVIYAKRADTMPDIIVTLIVSLFLAVVVHNKRIDPAVEKTKRGVLIINRAYIISMAVFVAVTGAVTMMIDKPTYFSKLERDSSYFDYVQTNGTGAGDYEDMSNESSDRRGGLDYTYNPLFYMTTDGTQDEYYLRRQAYDTFNGDTWETLQNTGDFDSAYSSVVPEYAVDDVLADMTELAALDDGISSPNVSEAIKLRSAHVYDETFAPLYLPAPLGVVTDNDTFSNLKYRKYKQTSVIRSDAWGKNTYPALDDRFEFIDQENALYGYAFTLGLNNEDYVEMLENYSYMGSEAAERLLEDWQAAYDRYSSLNGVTDKLVQFSYSLTADCKSDMEKALALEQYFSNNGYLYSLEYVPEDNSIDYFVFESKTGYCVAYATAMTLMARAVGLPARYVEGFAAYERTEEGSIVVRDGHAHAFVEVYIPGTGWLTFDPTVSDYLDTPNGDTGSNFNMALFFRIMSRFIVVIGVGFVVIFVLLLDRIVELIFRIRLHFAVPKRKVLMLYANVIRLVNISTREDHSSYTVKMLRGYLYQTRGLCPDKLFDLFEKTAFGGYEPTREEFAEVYAEYRHCYKYLRRIPRPKELDKLRATA